VRIYVPASIELLTALVAHGHCSGSTGFAVTPEFRSAHADVSDEEELEFLAMTSAAAESLAQHSGRRVVLAVDMPTESVSFDSEADGRVTFPDGIERPLVASAHVDLDTETESDADASELLWFANQEFETLLQEKS
jgi:hypothetical protein